MSEPNFIILILSLLSLFILFFVVFALRFMCRSEIDFRKCEWCGKKMTENDFFCSIECADAWGAQDDA